MSGGIVYASGSATTGRFGDPVALAAAAVIPAGAWFIDAAWTLTAADASTHTMAAGYCLSDGVSCAMSAAGNAIPVGA